MRKLYVKLSLMLLISFGLFACKKETPQMGSGTSALTIVNGVPGTGPLLSNFNGQNLGVRWYSGLQRIAYAEFKFFSSYSGTQSLSLYQTADTSLHKALFNMSLDLPLHTMHTLFLTGTPQSPDTLFATDQPPHNLPADSTMGIRFVNISQGSLPVSVNRIGQAYGSEMSQLSYKGISAFRKYPANSKISSYTFEFRDQATGQLSGSIVLKDINKKGNSVNGRNLWLNKNFTLVLLGAATPGTAPDRVLLISSGY